MKLKNMKLFSVLISALLCLFAVAPVQAQTTQSFSASKDNQYGLRYSLPLTVVDITIETEHVRLVPGEFYNYASRHLAISDAVKSEETDVEISTVTIATRGVANPDSQWLVQFKRGGAVSMLLTADGRPLTVNTENVASTPEVELPEAEAAEPTILETEAARQAMTQEMIMSSSISKRAELAARRIFELREMRMELLAGEYDNPPADGKAMELVLENIAAQEAALTAMFAGTKQTWTNVKTITVVPDSAGIDSEIIARISPFDGILEADNLAGAPLSISIDVLDRGELPLAVDGTPKKFPKGGVAYAIPGKALVSLHYGGEIIASAEVSVAQLGSVFGIDPSLFSDKKSPSMLQFDPTTGAALYLGPVVAETPSL